MATAPRLGSEKISRSTLAKLASFPPWLKLLKIGTGEMKYSD
jgi:hypothetical protein